MDITTATYPPQKRTPSTVPSRPESKNGSAIELAHRHAGQGESVRSDDQAQVEVTPSKLSTSVERRYLASLFWVMIVCGWNDASSGPLIPRMQENFHIGYTIVSLIFVSICVGFFIAAGLNVWLEDRFGFGKVLLIGTAAQMTAYTLMATPIPFPAFCVAFVIAGFGSGTVLSLAAAFIMKLPTRQNLKMCLFQAFYGVGALVAPLIATQFTSMTTQWRFYYLVSLGLATTSFAIISIVFRGKHENDLLPDLVEVGSVNEGLPSAATPNANAETLKKMNQIMRVKAVHMLAIWSFIYVGLEVTIGGWIVTFIQELRIDSSNESAYHSAGYVSTGFWAGLTIGRLAFIWVNNKLGERRVVFGYTLIALGLEFIVWFVPDLIGTAVSVSLVGLCLGPMFPIMLSVASKSIPRALAAGSICWIESLGQVGSAMLPFATGALSQAFGIRVLQPIIVSLLGGMAVAWGAVLWFTALDKKRWTSD